MKILTVVGARPQFIKASAVSRALSENCTEVLVHTGQHYDENMSDVFFEELDIRYPDYNLLVGSSPHGKQTGEMLEKLEILMISERPDCVLVYGDTNSTLAGALTAAKLNIPVAHVEAGLRSYNRRMPEEINRVLTDHLSSWLFCPTETAMNNLKAEGIAEGVYHVGDVMCDAVLYYKDLANQNYGDTWRGRLEYLYEKKLCGERFYLATMHRAENTESPETLSEVLSAFELLDEPVIFPVHPRTRPIVDKLVQENDYSNVIFIKPVGYFIMLCLIEGAVKTVTDSGGLQKEAYILKKPCVTVRKETEWVETLNSGWNVLVHAHKSDIVEKCFLPPPSIGTHADYYGDGDAAEKIARLLC
jgi:UDP-N-acetylglucosamine 2-epimerase (non-hydrolysing)/UDP-GlcNAc3NAcA epimerase